MSDPRASSSQTTRTRVRELFDACVELSPHQRDAFLREQGVTAEVEQQLHALLRADARDADLFKTPAAAWAAQLQATPAEVEALVGTRVGGFRLVALLGQGGSSVVFRGERDVAGRVQAVALKLMRSGLFSSDAQRRFQREQGILIQLSHPNIAHLIDAGISDAGIPYIAMELVEGLALTEHARRAALDLPARLRLLADLARAVDAAHRLLVVHRDLKPSNVLVDAQGRVKVLDFGIAKLLGDETETATQHLALTPAYAAPEQYRSGVLTTAVDVYALGVIASELLLDARLGLDAALPRDGADGEALRERWRRLDPDLAGLLRVALAEDPAQRHASARHFADDIERFLRDEPMLARAPSRAHRLRKFVARHKVLVFGGSGFVLALVAALGVALWQADVARRQAARADSLRDFMFDAFADAEPSVPRDGPATVIDAVQRAIAASRESAGTDPDARLDLRLRLAQVLQRQGELEPARDLFAEVLAEARSALGEDAALTREAAQLAAQNAMARGDYVVARADLDAMLHREGDADSEDRVTLLSKSAVLATRVRDRERALADGREAVRLAHALGDEELLRQTLNDWGIVLLNVDALAEAVAVQEELLALNRKKFGAQHQKVANAQATLARVYRRLGDLPRAEAAARAAVEIDRAIYPGDDRHAASNLNSLMMVLRARRDFDGALEAAREALRINRATLGDDHPDTVISLYGVGELEGVLEQYDAAVPLLRDALARNERRFGDAHWNTAVTRMQYGSALAMSGAMSEGTAMLERAIEDLEKMADPDLDKLAAAIEKRVRVALHVGDTSGALAWIGRLERHGKDAPPARASWPGNVDTLRGAARLLAQDTPSALEALQRAATAIDADTGVERLLQAEHGLLLASALQAAGQQAAAVDATATARATLRTLGFVPRRLRALDDALPSPVRN
jgi:eukaryotic-like serine/threonine-protein kinase